VVGALARSGPGPQEVEERGVAQVVGGVDEVHQRVVPQPRQERGVERRAGGAARRRGAALPVRGHPGNHGAVHVARHVDHALPGRGGHQLRPPQRERRRHGDLHAVEAPEHHRPLLLRLLRIMSRGRHLGCRRRRRRRASCFLAWHGMSSL
jgi:hypothetical protein